MTVSINGNDFKRCKKETEMGRATENGLSEFLQHFLLPLWMCFFPRKSILSLNWKIPKVQKKKKFNDFRRWRMNANSEENIIQDATSICFKPITKHLKIASMLTEAFRELWWSITSQT